ncbi:MAG TPA: MFS transporter [Caulobacterales bacterium]|jgi:MFS family permease|nr:MFS transporter [Caulobacterales bacterium]
MLPAFLQRLLRRRAPSSPSSSFEAPRDGRVALMTLVSVIFINMLGFGIVVPLLPFYGQSFRAAPWEIALIFSAFSFGGFFGEPFWGRLSDRIGRKPLLISTVCGTCACYLALAFAPNVTIAFIVRFLGGLMSGNGSVIQGYLADVTPPHLRAGRIALMGAAYNVGFIVGPSLGGLLAHPSAGPIGFQIPILAAAMLSACSATGVILFVRESRPRSDISLVQPSRFAMFSRAAAHPTVSRLLLLTFVSGFAFTGIESTFGLWTQARFGWGPHEVGLIFGATGICAAVMNSLFTGALARRYGEATMLAVGMGFAATASLLLTLSTGMAMTIALMCMMAVGQSAAFPNVSALISRTTGPDHQGQVLGLNNASGAIARVSGPLCAGIAFADIDENGPFIMATAIVAPAIFLALAAGASVSRAKPL